MGPKVCKKKKTEKCKVFMNQDVFVSLQMYTCVLLRHAVRTWWWCVLVCLSKKNQHVTVTVDQHGGAKRQISVGMKHSSSVCCTAAFRTFTQNKWENKNISIKASVVKPFKLTNYVALNGLLIFLTLKVFHWLSIFQTKLSFTHSALCEPTIRLRIIWPIIKS